MCEAFAEIFRVCSKRVILSFCETHHVISSWLRLYARVFINLMCTHVVKISSCGILLFATSSCPISLQFGCNSTILDATQYFTEVRRHIVQHVTALLKYSAVCFQQTSHIRASSF